MESERLRRRICFEAARLLQSRQENDYGRARWRAARSITRNYIPGDAIPTDYEIRQALQQLTRHPHGQGANPFGDSTDDPWQYYASLLVPLEKVVQDRESHPEGDVLYHSLQVFELARDARPWDEEFLLAALLHDVGKGIDPRDHINAGLAVLSGRVPERTLWLIENHGTAHRRLDGTIGVRARRRLVRSEDGEALELLADCDRAGRVSGRRVGTVEDAISYLRELAEHNELASED